MPIPDSDATQPVINIQIQPNPLWTEEFLAHIQKYGAVAYGRGVTPEVCAKEQSSLASGSPHKRHAMRSHEIFVDGELAGEITVSSERDQDGRFEMTIAVLDDHAGCGVAGEALDQFLRANGDWPLSALVKATNPCPARVENLLQKAGFVRHPNQPDTLYVKDK